MCQLFTVKSMFNQNTFCRHERGPMAALWMNFLDMVELLLDLIRSYRESDWHLHLHTIRRLIPWCFAYDHVNYARYLSVYYGQMIHLNETHPDVYEHFTTNRGFSVQRGTTNPFAKLPVDQVQCSTVIQCLGSDISGIHVMYTPG